MSITLSNQLPSTRKLLKSTALAAAVAGVILLTTVLPAEYGIDPTGIGKVLGLDALASSDDAGAVAPPVPASAGGAEAVSALFEKAKVAFGSNGKQAFEPAAVSLASTPLRQDSLTIELAPGKGQEVKAHMAQGAGMVFSWKATSDVAVDMHGERPDVKGPWTSYAVEGAQRQAEGTFIAPFEGTHGWYWQNRGSTPVIIEVQITGYQADLYQP